MENRYKAQLDYAQMQMMNDVAKQSVEKVEQFKNRLASFEKITSLEEAKSLAAKIMPVAGEFNNFSIGDAKCTIINKKDLFRISIESEKEFIVYDFS